MPPAHGLNAINGLSCVNGLSTSNRLSSPNGMYTGLPAADDLWAATGIDTSRSLAYSFAIATK